MIAALRHMGRILRWGRILGRHGALREVERSPHAPVGLRIVARLARLGTQAPERPAYAAAFQAIGPAAIKLGQALATRPDLIGTDAADDLSQLQDALPAAPFADIQATIAAAFDQPVSALFTHIDPDPVGAASIAQVHKAITSDGRTVAIKVLRTGVEQQIESAIETYEWMARHLEAMGGEVARMRPRAVIARFRHWTQIELDLKREAASASELRDLMAGQSDLHVPAIDWKRTSRRVLTLEWIDGIKLTDDAALRASGLDRKALAGRLVRAFLMQTIGCGYFHADLHQGNLFALPDGRLALVDFGIMGRLNRRARIYLAEILHGLLVGDYRRVAEIHFEAGYVPAHHNIDDFATALRAIGEPIQGAAVKDIAISALLEGLFAITRTFQMPTQPHLLLLQKSMVMVEGVALRLDPDVNMWTIGAPYISAWMRDEMGPEAHMADSLTRMVRRLHDLPDLFDRLARLVPPQGAAPPDIPLPDTPPPSRWRPLVYAVIGGMAVGWAIAHWMR